MLIAVAKENTVEVPHLISMYGMLSIIKMLIIDLGRSIICVESVWE